MDLAQFLFLLLDFFLGLCLRVGDFLDFIKDLFQIVQADGVTETDEGQHVALDALDVLVDGEVGVLAKGGFDLWLVFLVCVCGFKVLIILIKVFRIIRPITRLHLQLLLFCQLLLLIKLLIFRMWVSRLVVHRVVHVHALMIKQLGEGHHCCVLEILAETPSD